MKNPLFYLFFITISCGTHAQFEDSIIAPLDTIHVRDTIVQQNDTIVRDTVILGQNSYSNPIIKVSLPDPTVIRTPDKRFYLYATEDIHNLPIYRSDNFIDWEFVGTAFTNETRPDFLKGGVLWAPNINYINNEYRIYYTLSKWGEVDRCGVGIAIANNPEGPFTDLGKLFVSKEIGISNGIDPFLVEENGNYYLFVGGLHGLYVIELSEDGLSIKEGTQPIRIASSGVEGSFVYKKDGYYYLFCSKGRCCEGLNSNYHVVYGRSKSLLGPYETKAGKKLLNGNFDILLQGNDFVAGPGHNARFITDDNGQDWMIYHGYLRSDVHNGRITFLDPVYWEDGWPYIKNGSPSKYNYRPTFK
ncbi:MAG: family 43 glycosylhydrolase [Prevotella sp.]|nr:family 43 glycosylhydrolase [Prevotella sp.]